MMVGIGQRGAAGGCEARKAEHPDVAATEGQDVPRERSSLPDAHHHEGTRRVNEG